MSRLFQRRPTSGRMGRRARRHAPALERLEERWPLTTVALLHADYDYNVNDVANTLAQYGGFTSIGRVNLTSSTPTLAALQAYDSVLVWSNSSFFNPAGLGNVLADYVDQGGGVVQAWSSNSTYSSSHNIQGRWTSGGYSPYVYGYTYSTANATLGTVHQPSHPVMQGVSTFNVGSGGYAARVSLTSGTTAIADLSSGYNLVAERPALAGRVIGLNFCPVSSSAASSSWPRTTDGGRLLGNATMYAAGATPLTVAITADKTALKAGEAAAVTFALSEASSTFAVEDITVAGGTLSNFAGSGASYTATFTPAPNSTTPGTLSVAVGAFTNAEGNTSVVSPSLGFTIDTKVPTVRITSNAPLLESDGPFTLTFLVSESVTSFGSDDVQAQGGTLSNFTGSGAVYTATFTPTPGDASPRRVAIPAATFADAAGNSNEASELAIVPWVSLELASTGSEADGSSTVFRLKRSGGITAPLAVNVLLSGTATPGIDYGVPSSTQPGGRVAVVFPAGARTVDLELPTLPDVVRDPLETILAIVQPAATYTAAPARDRATAVITAEGVTGRLLGASAGVAANQSAFAGVRSDGSVVTWGDAQSGGYTAGVDLDGPADNLTIAKVFSNDFAFAAIRSDGSVVSWGEPYSGGNSSAVDFNGQANNLTVTQIYSTGSAFAALRSDGSVVTWGSSSYGGNSSAVDFDGPADNLTVTQISSTDYAFAALRSDGSVVSWGEPYSGGDSSAVDFNGPADNLTVTQIYSNQNAFAALRSDGSVVTWGYSDYGGNSSGVDFNGPADNLTVTQIYSNANAFAALRSDGSVVTWGRADYYGNYGGDSSAVDFDGPADNLTVTQIYSNPYAFAALRSDGSVVTWGYSYYGGNSSAVDFNGPADNLTVTQIYSNNYAFAALRSDGSVVTWGDSYYGGNSSAVDFNGPTDNLTVIKIYSNLYAFAALRSDGSVVTWGDSSSGGNSSAIDFNGPTNTLTVTKIYSNQISFAALRSDGSVVTWGNSSSGGNSSAVDFDGSANNLTVTQIYSTSRAFLAVRNDATAVTWGEIAYGGNAAGIDFDGPADNLTVTQIYSNPNAFAAIRSDGSVVAWGSSDYGGNSSAVDFNGPANNLTVTQIYSNPYAFAALRSDGSVVTWGNSSSGGDSSAVDFNGPANNLTVTQIYSTNLAFAALRSDGSVVTWGYSDWGGNSSAIDFDGPANNLTVTQIYSNPNAFAALRSDGSVVTWGTSYYGNYGGDSSTVDFDGPANNLTVTQIYSNPNAFAALRSDGSVVTWGYSTYGGDSSTIDFDGPANNLTVTQIYSNQNAFAALRSNGSVVTWGYSSSGGDSSTVDFDGPANNLAITQIYSTGSAFAALRSDGSVVTWGSSSWGGDSSAVDFDGAANNLAVTQIYSSPTAFAALRSDGSVVTWGSSDYGGNSSAVDFDGPANNLTVTQVYSTNFAFAALRSDGSVVTWGYSSHGGNSSAVDFNGPNGNLMVAFLANTSISASQLTIETTPPTVTITSTKTSLKVGETATVTFTLSEPVTGLPAAAVTVTGGTLGSISGSGATYSAVFTPTEGSTTPGSIVVVAGKILDPAGNPNTASNTVSLTIDTVAPSVTITSDKAALKAGEAASITFTLSESAGDFGEDDVTVSGGTLSNFSGTGASYTAIFTPTAASTTPGSISVAAGKFTDTAGNANTASNTVSLTIETIVPTIAITSDKTALKAGESATITFTLSESSTDFGEGDVTVSGGTLSGFSGTGTSYTATFTPTVASTTPGSISVAAAKFTDAAGNPNTASDPLPISIDTVVPTIAITSDKTALKAGETASITFTLSESAGDFGEDDVTVSGGTLSNFSGTGTSYTATFTPTVDSTTPGAISVASAKFTDAAGNPNTASDPLVISIDTVVPTIAITSDKTALKAGETATITFTLSESASDFNDDDVTVSGGTLSNFSGTGTSYTATFTPTVDSTTLGAISVVAATFTDAAGNANTASDPVSITIDTVVPTIAITSNKSALKAGETATITFTLSESASDFGDDDVTVSGGTLSNFTGTGVSYTATFTPAAASTTPGSISVASATFTDAAGNPNTASDPLALSIDTVVPTIAITSNKTALKAGETATITFTLSESSTDFGNDDVTVSGGTLSGFSGTGTSYTATFTPTAASTTAGSISVAAAKFTDAAGNQNTASDPLALTIDTVVPTITITSNKAALKAGETATITFTLSKVSTNFAVADVTASGGALSNFSGTGASYTATFTPTPSSTNPGSISVAAAKFTDSAGNANTAGSPVALSIDTLLPTAVITTVPVATGGAMTSATVTFSEPVQGVRLADFQLTRDGTAVPLTGAAVTGSGRTWTVTGLAPLTSSLGTYVFTLRGDAAARDLAGNPLAASANRSWAYATPFEIVGLPATTTAALSKLTIRLTGPVKGFEKVDIRLTLNGQVVSLFRANLDLKRGVYELSGLGPLTQANGTYTVTIGRANSKMLDGNGKPITGVLQASWVKRR